jgi:hypothetical protein
MRSSLSPSENNAFALSSLRCSNASSATDFSATADYSGGNAPVLIPAPGAAGAARSPTSRNSA